MGETTITVSDRTLERFKHLKSESDEHQDSVPDHTNESFLQSLMDTWEAADDGYYDDETIAGQLDVDESEIAKQVANDLQSTLPRKIAEELQ